MDTLQVAQPDKDLAPSRPTNILVLEDDADVRDLWLEDLRDAGYTAVGVGRGLEALALMARLHPTLVVSDVIMPDMDGFEFLKQIRRDSRWSQVPVLFVSSLAEGVCHAVGSELSIDALGIVGILSKPVRHNALVDRVRRIIGRRAEPDENPDAG